MDEQQNQQPNEAQTAPVQPVTGATGGSNVEKNKLMAIIGYLIPILFFIPLLDEETKKSPFAKFHANQQLLLLLFCIIGYTASSVLVFVLIGFILYPLVVIASLVFMIMGIISTAKGEMKKLPVIGGYEIIK